MNNNKDKIQCLILNCVDNDFQSIWEIASVIESKGVLEASTELSTVLCLSLKKLLANKLIELYKGNCFNGDEQLMHGFKITRSFIDKHLNDWTNKGFNDLDYRFYITELGRKKLIEECNPSFFT